MLSSVVVGFVFCSKNSFINQCCFLSTIEVMLQTVVMSWRKVQKLQ